MKVEITIPVDWVQGHLRYGHLEGTFEVSNREELNSLLADQDLRYDMDLVLDDYEVDSYGDLGEPSVTVLEE